MLNARSWQTTTAGLVQAVGVLLLFILPLFDIAITQTKADQVAGAIVLIIGTIWHGVAARDDGVSSEGRRAPKAIKLMLLMLTPMLFFGCTAQRIGGNVDAKAAGYASAGSARNTMVENADGSRVQDYSAEAPTSVTADKNGVENRGAVSFGTVHIDLPDGTRLLATVPNDFKVDSVQIPQGEGIAPIVLGGVSINTSDVVVARAQIVVAMTPIIEAWTEQQKQAMLAQYEAQAKAGDVFAQTLVPIIKASLGIGG